MRYIFILTFFFVLFNTSCEDTNAPLDAKSRRTIDSISTAQIRQLRIELDSLCKIETTQKMDFLVDSIKKERLKEIEELKKGAAQ